MCNIPGTASASLGRDRSGYLHAAATSGLMAALSCVAMRRTCSSMHGFYSTLARRFSGLTLRLVGGQVISSGFRDAASLAWRLALLCRQSTLDSPRHEAVLKNWYLERKQQLEKSLALTIRNREFVTECNPLKIFLRFMLLVYHESSSELATTAATRPQKRVWFVIDSRMGCPSFLISTGVSAYLKYIASPDQTRHSILHG